MQRIGFFLFTALLFATYTSDAQSQVTASGVVAETDLQITYSKTSSIIFPWHIVAVDRGSADLLVQKARNIANVLQLKARRRNMAATNLTVITADGLLYHFPIRYAESPERLTVQLNGRMDSASSIIFENMTAQQFERDANNILHHAGYNFIKGKRKDGVAFTIEGIYVRGPYLYYHLHVDNGTSLDYAVDQLAFYVKDNRKVKRTAFQEISLKPLYHKGDVNIIKAYAHEDIVICLDKFTLADDRHLTAELTEMNGGRNLVLKLKNRHLLKAEPLATLE